MDIKQEFKNHTFVICAYKISEYLEDCIKSVINQSIKSNIIMVTSTPNDHIKNLANKYNIQLYINEGETGIGQDWNFGVSKTTTDYVTIAHQDDIYEKNYLEEILKLKDKHGEFVLAFTKYKEIKKDEIIKLNRTLKVKEILLFPLKFFRKSKFIKKLCLSFGSSICCPSVTLNTKIVGKKPFKTKLKCDLDWDTWLELTKYKGLYLYASKYLMLHRIHEESATSKLIENNIRLQEDYEMFSRLWPKFIAKILTKFYSNSIKTNKIDNNLEKK